MSSPSFLQLALLSVLIVLNVSDCLAEIAERPRIGLVLGGGGARGAAHIGVLAVLREQRIPIDCVAGTSMGGLVSGAFAAGLSPDEMLAAMGKVDWRDMFNDNPPANELNPRRKHLARRFITGSETGVSENGFEALPGAVDGQKIKLFINEMVHGEFGDPVMEKLPIPVSIVSTDLVTGGKVVFRQGSLTKAMRASMSVPAAMSPVKDGNKLLVDGALVANVPIEEAREQCDADVVIAVNVGSPLLKAEQIGGIPSTMAQVINILTEQNVIRSLADLQSADILIKPDLDGIGPSDFNRYRETVGRGRAAAEAILPRLQQLSVDKESYGEWLSKTKPAHSEMPLVVNEIEIAKLHRVNPAYVERHLQKYEGVPLDTKKLSKDLGRVYGDGEYQHVDYALLTGRDKNILRITPLEKEFGPDYLRFGLNLESTIDSSSYNFRAAYHKTWLNSLGGEWLSGAQIGTEPMVFTEFYQPIDRRQRFFIDPKIIYRKGHFNFYQNNSYQSQYEVKEFAFDMMSGVNVGLLGPLSFGWSERRRSAELNSGISIFDIEDDSIGGWVAKVDFDQFDSLYVPTHGWAVKGEYFDSSDENYSKGTLDLRVAQNIGEYVFSGRYNISGSLEGALPPYDAVALGGFLNLSGFAANQILGDSFMYGNMRLEKIIGQLPLGLRGDMRVGLALETGRVDGRYSESELDGWQNSLALYIGGETPVGPVFIGYGYSPEGMSSLYVFFGTP
ncbi:MAG: patatin [Desulfobulbaceae bacterium]|nr:MAG: patatin [Desulfobulbaceae bacterium]